MQMRGLVWIRCRSVTPDQPVSYAVTAGAVGRLTQAMGQICKRRRTRLPMLAKASVTACRSSGRCCLIPAIRLRGASDPTWTMRSLRRAGTGCSCVSRGELIFHCSTQSARLHAFDFEHIVDRVVTVAGGVPLESRGHPFLGLAGNRRVLRQPRSRRSTRGRPRLRCWRARPHPSGRTSWQCGGPWHRALHPAPSCSRPRSGAMRTDPRRRQLPRLLFFQASAAAGHRWLVTHSRLDGRLSDH